MSFASQAKNAICKTQASTWCCRRSELCALVCFAGDVSSGGALKIRIENENVAAQICILLSDILGMNDIHFSRPAAQGGWYTLVLSRPEELDNLADGLGLLHDGTFTLYPNEDITDFDCCKLSFIRGAFLGGGSIIAPEKNYHMEFVTRRARLADKLTELLEFYGVNARLTVRKNHFVVYLKESDAIAELLGILGAGGAMMELYNVKIERELRNAVNRQVNCDSANMDKTIAAASRQLQAIKKIQNSVSLDALPDTLKEMARLRVENPELPLGELGKLANPPIGKSGVNHRLGRIIEFAETLSEHDIK